MTKEVREILYEDGQSLVSGERDLIYHREGKQYGLFVDERLVSILSAVEQGEKIKIKAMYTLPDERRKGYSEFLLRHVLKVVGKPVIAGALESSVGIFIKLGFRIKRDKQFSRFKIYYMEKE